MTTNISTPDDARYKNYYYWSVVYPNTDSKFLQWLKNKTNQNYEIPIIWNNPYKLLSLFQWICWRHQILFELKFEHNTIIMKIDDFWEVFVYYNEELVLDLTGEL